jgi:hypothetical protein
VHVYMAKLNVHDHGCHPVMSNESDSCIQQNGPLKMPLTSHDLVELSLFISHIRAHAQETRAYAEWHAARIWMSPEIDPQVYREILDFSV